MAAREPLLEQLRVPAAIVLGAALVTMIFAATGSLQGPELFFYDLRLKGNPAPEVSDAILPIPVDDASTDRIGRWPWPRPLSGELARDLGRAGARVVLLDITYSDRTLEADDARFVQVMSEAPAAISAYFVLPLSTSGEELTDEKKATIAAFDARFPFALPGAAAALPNAPRAERVYVPLRGLVDAQVGRSPTGPTSVGAQRRSEEERGVAQERGPTLAIASLDRRLDRDGIVRRVPTLFRRGDRWLPSLPLALACKWYDVDPSRVIVTPGLVTIPGAVAPGEVPRDVRIPVDSAGRMLVRYAQPGVLASRFVSAYRVRNALAGGDDRALHTKDRIALVYLSYFGHGDLHDTPVGLDHPGGLVVGEAVNTILTGAHVRVPPWWIVPLFVLAEALALLAATARWTSYRLGLAGLGVLFTLFTAGFALFNATAIMVPLASAGMFAALAGGGMVVWRTFLEDRERIDMIFTLRALQNQALKERKQAVHTTLGASTGASEVTDALRRNVEYSRFIDSLRDIEALENTYIGKHYRLLNLIDEGGMGLVFRAYDEIRTGSHLE